MLDQQQLSMLTAEEKTRYRLYEQGFSTEFWKAIQEMAQTQSDSALIRAAEAQSWDFNRVAVGQRSVWQLLANLETAIENEYITTATERQQQETSRYLEEEGRYE